MPRSTGIFILLTMVGAKEPVPALGGIPSPEAIALAMPYLDEPETRDEAGAAAVSVAEKLLKGQNAKQAASKVDGAACQCGAGGGQRRRGASRQSRAGAREAEGRIATI